MEPGELPMQAAHIESRESLPPRETTEPITAKIQSLVREKQEARWGKTKDQGDYAAKLEEWKGEMDTWWQGEKKENQENILYCLSFFGASPLPADISDHDSKPQPAWDNLLKSFYGAGGEPNIDKVTAVLVDNPELITNAHLKRFFLGFFGEEAATVLYARPEIANRREEINRAVGLEQIRRAGGKVREWEELVQSRYARGREKGADVAKALKEWAEAKGSFSRFVGPDISRRFLPDQIKKIKQYLGFLPEALVAQIKKIEPVPPGKRAAGQYHGDGKIGNAVLRLSFERKGLWPVFLHEMFGHGLIDMIKVDKRVYKKIIQKMDHFVKQHPWVMGMDSYANKYHLGYRKNSKRDGTTTAIHEFWADRVAEHFSRRFGRPLRAHRKKDFPPGIQKEIDHICATIFATWQDVMRKAGGFSDNALKCPAV